MGTYDKKLYSVKLIEHGLDLLKIKYDFASEYFLALSKISCLDDRVKSFLHGC